MKRNQACIFSMGNRQESFFWQLNSKLLKMPRYFKNFFHHTGSNYYMMAASNDSCQNWKNWGICKELITWVTDVDVFLPYL